MALVAGKSGGEQGFFQLADLRYVNGLAIQLRSLTWLGAEQFIPGGVVNDRSDSLLGIRDSTFDRKGNAEHWKAVGKVGGPIQRIYIPAIFVAAIVEALLFT